MPTITGRTSFPFYCPQINDLFCGPACAQIILKSLGMTGLDQNAIAASGEIRNPVEPWASRYNDWVTRPDETAKMIQSGLAGTRFTFTPGSSSSSADFRRRLKSLIEDLTIPPPVTPVHQQSHWVVLFQYQDENRKRSFYGYDPIYLGPVPDDNPCSVPPAFINLPDTPKNFQDSLNLVAVANTSIARPRSAIGRLAARIFPAGINAMITVSDGENFPEEQEAPDSQTYHENASSGQFPPKEIPKKTIEELTAYGLLDPNNGGSLAGTSPGPPLLVKRPDAPDRNYYLVGMQNSLHQNRLLVRLDASDGQYLDSLLIQPTEYLMGRSSVGSITYKKIYEQLVVEMKKGDWFREFEAELTRTDQEGVNTPNLIWIPCNESLSAFYPFYRVKVTDATFYVRIDGAIFRELTRSPKKYPISLK